MTANIYKFGPVLEGDAVALTALRAAFFQSQVDAGMLDIPVDHSAALARTTAAIMRGGRSYCVVARTQAGIAAYIYFVIRTVPGMEKSAIGSVEEVYVDPSAKRQGIAGKLVDLALAQMRDLKVDRIQARVISTNDPAVKFWEKEGFVENVRILEFPVEEV